MKNKKRILFVLVILFASIFGMAQAQVAPSVNLTIRDGSTIIFEGAIPLPPAGTIELNGHPLNADSVLAVLNEADLSSENFAITDLQYYDSMGSFYLKCINTKCDYWQYVVNDVYPGVGMDQKILSGGEEVYVYFSPQHKITLSSSQITTAETLSVKAENYAYRTNTWEPLTGVTIGVTKPNPADPFSPTEIQTSPVNGAGQASFSNLPADSYNLGIKEDFYFPTEALTVTTPADPPPSNNTGGGGGSIVMPKISKTVFDINKAYEFLTKEQKEDGTMGDLPAQTGELYTDWATLALMNTDQYQETKIKLLKYYSSGKIQGKLLTDYERRAMAVMALGLNPYNVNGENYIEKIVAGFDGTQFGEKKEVNDDIFALIVLQNAGFQVNEEIIQKTINFILSQQKADGSWNESVDMTGAGIEALTAFAGKNLLLRGVSQADEPRGSAPLASGDSDLEKEEFFSAKVYNTLLRAKAYLKQKQKTDGSWENVPSTSWALQGLLSLDEKIEDSTLDYLAKNQDSDGGVKAEGINNRIWNTAYVLTSLSGKTWTETMQKFDPVRNSSPQGDRSTRYARAASNGTIKKEVISKSPTITTEEVQKIENTPEPQKEQRESGLKNFMRTIFGLFF